MAVKVNAGKDVPGEVTVLLYERAEATLDRFGVATAEISKGDHQFPHTSGNYGEYYVLTPETDSETFPVKKWVAFKKTNNTFETVAVMQPGYTTADLPAA